MECDFGETFYTVSGTNVLRGMHFQMPPADQAKLVYCISGAIFDIALDMRAGSPTFGEHETFELSEGAHNALYLPRGMAHGFYTRTAPAVVVYQVTSEHSPANDFGVRWDSFGATWPLGEPVISNRDEALIPFQQFESPFHFEQEAALNLASKRDPR